MVPGGAPDRPGYPGVQSVLETAEAGDTPLTFARFGHAEGDRRRLAVHQSRPPVVRAMELGRFGFADAAGPPAAAADRGDTSWQQRPV